MKKVLTLVLAMAMVLGLLAGCGGSGSGSTYVEGEPVTLHYYIAGFPGQPDLDKVFAEVNKYIQTIRNSRLSSSRQKAGPDRSHKKYPQKGGRKLTGRGWYSAGCKNRKMRNLL